MKIVETRDKKAFLDQIQNAIENTVSKNEAELIIPFTKQLFATAFIDEFEGRRVLDVVGMVLSAWRFASSNTNDAANIQIFNPNIEEHNWQSPHTVLCILTKNTPFIVDSIRMLLSNRMIKIHSIQHAVLGAQRSDNGDLISVDSINPNDQSSSEAILFLEIDRHSDSASVESLNKAVSEVLEGITKVVNDYHAMLDVRADISASVSKGLFSNLSQKEQGELTRFLDWMGEENLTFLGSASYKYSEKKTTNPFALVKNSVLGVGQDYSDMYASMSLNSLGKTAQGIINSEQAVIFSKSNLRSIVHRDAYPECIAIKKYDKKGALIGLDCFFVLLTAKAYKQAPTEIPYVKGKIDYVIKKSGLDVHEYRGKELTQLISVYPREDLFQVSQQELFDIVISTLYMQEKKQAKLFIREDVFSNFVNCLVYIPREIYSTAVRLKIQQILQDNLPATDIDFSTYISESVLARTHIALKVDRYDAAKVNFKEIEEKIIALAQSWESDLEQSLFEAYSEEQANDYINQYRNAFSASYREEFSPRRAAIDIENIDKVASGKEIGISFYRTLEENDKIVHFKLFHADQPVPLSDVMPIFENMGFRVIGEHPYESIGRNGCTVWLHDFMLTTTNNIAIDIPKIRDNCEVLFTKVWQGEAENDSFNRLLISAYMNWRQIAMLRSYSRYMHQIRISNSQQFIANTIVNNTELAKQLCEFFKTRFSPELFNGDNLGVGSYQKRVNALDKIEAKIIEQLNGVQNLSEDKVLRVYLDLIKATMRTNFYQNDESGADKSYISFKFQPRLIPNVPLPVPMFEIFVYSPRVEGVHLRGGKVARGGLRWSDRYEDYRTEVLGLVKAQQVKNAVIVPVGAKGGFVAKQLPEGNRDAFFKEGVACYQTFITGLINVTDNLIEGEVVKPTQVVCHDEDDYYLVVAADKGTATFSDIANEISLDKGHWLGDAFASGGSQGYDHKKMGITAKGAWVSVQRHFREIGHNIQEQPFTAIGVGDMAGDVFGNGMLLSEQTKLVAAFNHMHIFFDPDPDPAKSFKERKRLFELPRSTWEDYNKKLMSKGGGIFSRSAKSIALSKELKDFLGTQKDSLAPTEVINLILKARADLLWFGGIGTYVRSSLETDADVGDKANDALRIEAKDLNVKVVGEGGNLGMTQLSRIQYAQKGGRLNTDFIDNAAGVDCSDHEVNIKILLNEVLQNGDLTEKQRNKLLADMTDNVSDLVLHNNYRQTQAISLAESEASIRLEEYRRLINSMESQDKLNRELEFLPSDEQIIERKADNLGLTRPELSVMISYVKGDLKEQFNNSDLPDTTHLQSEVETAFPIQIIKKYSDELYEHRLRREIISTQVANDLVNHMGITFVERLKQSTGASVSSIALAYIIARNVFDLEKWWCEIESLDHAVKSELQYEMMTELQSLMRRVCRWLIRNRRSELNVADNMAKFKSGISKISKSLPDYLTGSSKADWDRKFKAFTNAGVPEGLASTIAGARHLYSALGIIEAQEQGQGTIDTVAKIYYLLGSKLELTWFGLQINSLKPLTHWQALARETFREDLDWQQRALTVGLLKLKDAPKNIDKRVGYWMSEHADLVERWQLMLTEFKATKDAEFSMYSVALRELLDLAQSTVHFSTSNEAS